MNFVKWGSRPGSFDAPARSPRFAYVSERVRPSLPFRLGHSPTAYPNLTRQSRFALKISTYTLSRGARLIIFMVEQVEQRYKHSPDPNHKDYQNLKFLNQQQYLEVSFELHLDPICHYHLNHKSQQKYLKLKRQHQ